MNESRGHIQSFGSIFERWLEVREDWFKGNVDTIKLFARYSIMLLGRPAKGWVVVETGKIKSKDSTSTHPQGVRSHLTWKVHPVATDAGPVCAKVWGSNEAVTDERTNDCVAAPKRKQPV
ncbi:hypothetical protein SEMRO_242_G096660.1 [Seminavis robusta]|uniref:Uncharacterized protein n=1 Tax=Seminavis robusta TaxID=568900 RepID=A0A9N8HD20_9STRA|nr:hypothetical protein SEMRO_242_G096660.1 [Seminavis robusta]|eukprot:Sro242_g096660.1 n/a (120) ;mRNA; f:55455-55814